jgi:diacylglycerol kinase
VIAWLPRFTARETGYWADDNGRREMSMGLLWLLVILLIIFAIFGGVAVSNWLWLLLIIALVLILVGYV